MGLLLQHFNESRLIRFDWLLSLKSIRPQRAVAVIMLRASFDTSFSAQIPVGYNQS